MGKIKVLQAGGASSFGGIESFQYNLFKYINKDEYSFDFIINNTSNKIIYEDKIKELGGRVFYIPSRRQGYLKRILLYRHLLKNNQYDIIHIHCGALVDDLFLSEALKTKARVFLHSHSSNFTGNKLGYWLHKYNRNKYINGNINRLACSLGAGKWMHCNSVKQNDFFIINNGIELNNFCFDISNRIKIRRELNIDEKTIVIGHIARFSQEKNYSYIIKVLSELIKKNKNIKLLLIGDGVLKSEVEKTINDYGLNNYVLFLGLRQDISDLLSAMDVFILPSIHEGLPITLLETQASGLKSIISESVTDEICLTDYIVKLPIDDKHIEKWVDHILNSSQTINRNYDLFDTNLRLFDCNYVAREVERIYRSNYVYDY